MNCKHVQELLPLYVGCDLEDKRAQLVTTHVQSCAECAGAASEYRESRQLLQQFAPPQFSEAVYAGIRQRVLREIEEESTALTPFNFVASLFRPRLRWAFAVALMLAVSVFAFYFIANRRSNQPQIAGSGGPVDRTKPDEQANEGSPVKQFAPPSSLSNEGNNGAHPQITGIDEGRETTIAGSQPPRRKSSGAGTDRASFMAGNVAANVAVNTPDNGSITAEASREPKNLPEPNAIPARDASSEKTLRVEMQTKDPNIRIIWFSPQHSKQDSPGKSSKRIQEVRSYA
ncbi:MAG: zf-HC2 domain-containing protein [Pyrinomonadaceae bacterium]